MITLLVADVAAVPAGATPPPAPSDFALAPETSGPVPATWTPARGPVLDPRSAWRRHRRAKLEVAVGGFYNWIYAAQAYGGDGLIAIGSTGNQACWDVNFQYAIGTTVHGLTVQKWRFGWTWDWIFDRIRFGLRPTLGYITFERATLFYDEAGPSYIDTLFIGLDAHASYDIVAISDLSALFLSAAVKVDGGAWGPVLQVGIRGDVVVTR